LNLIVVRYTLFVVTPHPAVTFTPRLLLRLFCPRVSGSPFVPAACVCRVRVTTVCVCRTVTTSALTFVCHGSAYAFTLRSASRSATHTADTSRSCVCRTVIYVCFTCHHHPSPRSRVHRLPTVLTGMPWITVCAFLTHWICLLRHCRLVSATPPCTFTITRSCYTCRSTTLTTARLPFLFCPTFSVYLVLRIRCWLPTSSHATPAGPHCTRTLDCVLHRLPATVTFVSLPASPTLTAFTISHCTFFSFPHASPASARSTGHLAFLHRLPFRLLPLSPHRTHTFHTFHHHTTFCCLSLHHANTPPLRGYRCRSRFYALGAATRSPLHVCSLACLRHCTFSPHAVLPFCCTPHRCPPRTTHHHTVPPAHVCFLPLHVLYCHLRTTFCTATRHLLVHACNTP